MEFGIQHDLKRLEALYEALWRERYLWPSRGASVVAVGCAMAMLFQRAAPWYLVVPATVAVLVEALLRYLRAQAHRSLADAATRAALSNCRYEIDDIGIRALTPRSEARHVWSMYSRTRELAGYLLLQRRRDDNLGIVALPLDQLPASARSFIEDRIGRISMTPVG